LKEALTNQLREGLGYQMMAKLSFCVPGCSKRGKHHVGSDTFIQVENSSMPHFQKAFAVVLIDST
jgi:hypothetical protein